jgi:hypothetical protein
MVKNQMTKKAISKPEIAPIGHPMFTIFTLKKYNTN